MITILLVCAYSIPVIPVSLAICGNVLVLFYFLFNFNLCMLVFFSYSQPYYHWYLWRFQFGCYILYFIFSLLCFVFIFHLALCLYVAFPLFIWFKLRRLLKGDTVNCYYYASVCVFTHIYICVSFPLVCFSLLLTSVILTSCGVTSLCIPLSVRFIVYK